MEREPLPKPATHMEQYLYAIVEELRRVNDNLEKPPIVTTLEETQEPKKRNKAG